MQVIMEGKYVKLEGKTLVIELGIDNDWFGQRDDYPHFATNWYVKTDGMQHNHEELYDLTNEGYAKAREEYEWLIVLAELGKLEV